MWKIVKTANGKRVRTVNTLGEMNAAEILFPCDKVKIVQLSCGFNWNRLKFRRNDHTFLEYRKSLAKTLYLVIRRDLFT